MDAYKGRPLRALREDVVVRCLVVLLLPSLALASPVLSHQARVLDTTGTPIDGAVVLEVALFDEQGSPSAFLSESTSVTAEQGYVSLSLGADAGNPLNAADMADGETWILYSIGGSPLGARQRLSSVPHAAAADTVIGGVVDASSLSVDGVVVMDSPGVVSGDLVVDGSLSTSGIQFPYTVTIDGRSWLDETQVQLNGANPVLNTNGTLNTGASFSGSGDYITVPVLAPGLVADERYAVSVSWRRTCRTADCDTITRVRDGSGIGWYVAAYDNSSGQSPIANADGSEIAEYNGVGQPTLVYVDALMGGGQPTTLTRRIRLNGNRSDAFSSTQVSDLSDGLTLTVGRGDAGEGYTEHFIEVTIDRAP